MGGRGGRGVSVRFQCGEILDKISSQLCVCVCVSRGGGKGTLEWTTTAYTESSLEGLNLPRPTKHKVVHLG